MANNFAQIGARVDALITKLNFSLNGPITTPGTVYEQICYVDDSGIGKAGSEQAQYPIRVIAQKPKFKGDTEPRDFTDPIVWNIYAGSKRIDIWGETYPVSESRDPYGMFKTDAPDVIVSAEIFWQELVADLLNANGLAYDGVSFFNTAHKANKAVIGSSDFSNDLSGSALEIDEDGVIAAFDGLQRIPGPNGQLANTVITNPYLLCATQKQYRKALKLQQSGAFLAKLLTATAAASEVSAFQGEFTPILMPQLYKPTVADTAKFWYVGTRSGSKRRPVLIRITGRPRFEMDQMRGAKNALGIYAWAEGDVVLSLPHTLVRCKTA